MTLFPADRPGGAIREGPGPLEAFARKQFRFETFCQSLSDIFLALRGAGCVAGITPASAARPGLLSPLVATRKARGVSSPTNLACGGSEQRKKREVLKFGDLVAGRKFSFPGRRSSGSVWSAPHRAQSEVELEDSTFGPRRYLTASPRTWRLAAF